MMPQVEPPLRRYLQRLPHRAQHLAGIVVNDRVNVMRPDFDGLKATLTNCVRRGPLTQNREAHPDFRAHLRGRIAFAEMINPARGARLRRIFEKIEWR